MQALAMAGVIALGVTSLWAQTSQGEVQGRTLAIDRDAAAPTTRGAVASTSQDGPELVPVARRALNAFHREDAIITEQSPEMRDALLWLAYNGDSQVVRVRAIHSLRPYNDSQAVRTLILDLLTNQEGPGALRAAAVRSATGFDLMRDEAMRQAILNLRDDTHPNVVQAMETLAICVRTDDGCLPPSGTVTP